LFVIITNQITEESKIIFDVSVRVSQTIKKKFLFEAKDHVLF